MKIIVTTNLFKFSFIPFLFFLSNQKQELNFRQIGSLVMISFLFKASRTVLQSHAEIQ